MRFIGRWPHDPPRCRQDQREHNEAEPHRGRTLAWPASVLWAGSTPAPLSLRPQMPQISIAFINSEWGATWYGFPGGQDFS